jgi:hypothetical protein
MLYRCSGEQAAQGDIGEQKSAHAEVCAHFTWSLQSLDCISGVGERPPKADRERNTIGWSV